MGKKSRMKRERRLARMEADPGFLMREMLGFPDQSAYKAEQEKAFQKSLKATQAVLSRYRRLDAAIALSVSELWPANVGSPIKHIFAWCVLLGLPDAVDEGTPISSYADFRLFLEALYKVWPSFPMLEDFSPETDWGQVKIRLGGAFVPMFYGSCVERTPDFVDAFRITYAHILRAQAQMDLVIALQARIIESMPGLATAIEGSKPGYFEVPPQDFWQDSSQVISQVGAEVAAWRDKAGDAFDARFGTFKQPMTWNTFNEAVMQGTALPFIAVENCGTWVPMSIRNAPGAVIDHWAKQKIAEKSESVHRALGQFVAQRFSQAMIGPLALIVGNVAIDDLEISCIVSAQSLVYLFCACDHTSSDRVAIAVKSAYANMANGALIQFRLPDGRALLLSKDGINGPSINEIRIIMVVTLASTAIGRIGLPERPARLLPLADLISIFDGLGDLDELEQYWKFVDSQKLALNPFSTGPVDLFASFRETHGVLIDGASSPALIGLDPHWGTAWRFKALANFWLLAPKEFPDGLNSWVLTPKTKGVVELRSRNRKVVAYSTLVGSCTVQTLVEIVDGLRLEDARMVDLFAQLIADCAYRCEDEISDLPLLQKSQVLVVCQPTKNSSVKAEDAPRSIEEFERVVTSAKESITREGLLYLEVDVVAVLAGLHSAKDGSFEVRCFLETLERCHAACGMEWPDGIADRVRHKVSEQARYHIIIGTRDVDVPDYLSPVIPSPTDYKLARKHLATEIMALGLSPGRFELAEAKSKIDSASARLRVHIENRLASLDRHQRLEAFIEQHDALLAAERMKVQRTRRSLAHQVEYDRLEAVEQARKEFGSAARHYRYLLEKTVSSPAAGGGEVTDNILRELVGLVDWYTVLTGASDVLHNGIDVGGVEIDDSYIPSVFYSTGFEDRESEFAREYAKSRLGLGANPEDSVEGAPEELLSSDKLRGAFETDLGFDLETMLTALAVLSQAQRYGFGDELALSYAAPPNRISDKLAEVIEGLDLAEAEKIVAFLTLSENGILRLAGRDVDEPDVPYWEHRKRIYRYSIRPLVKDGRLLRWGAETVSRAMHIWMSTVRDGYLPADFDWPTIKPVIRIIKESIEKKLEARTEEIFRRHTSFVEGGIDFFRRFRDAGFDDVGDFDVFAYWPDLNLLVTVECKYNQLPYTIKDGRRLRDQVFGKSEDDKAGQFSRILRRRLFLEKNCSTLLELLKWPKSDATNFKHVELYVSRDIHYWMVHPPYPVPTTFVQVEMLDSWIKTKLDILKNHV